MLFGKMKRDAGPLLLMRKGASPPPLPPKSNQTRKVGSVESRSCGGMVRGRLCKREGEGGEQEDAVIQQAGGFYN